ncbi:hypothetical protein AB0I84_42890, partial [Streptomyces spectabilis]
WLLRATGGRELTGRAVIVATGFDRPARAAEYPVMTHVNGSFARPGVWRRGPPAAVANHFVSQNRTEADPAWSSGEKSMDWCRFVFSEAVPPR